ncbi:hypothetical protein ACVW0K_006041 [Streptomyces filamentosus]
MKYLSPAGRLLAAAVSVVLAVTAGPAVTTAPALAAPLPSAAGAAEQARPFVLGTDERLSGSGADGFVTVSLVDSALVHQWHRFADGAVTPLPRNAAWDSRPVTVPDSNRVVVRTGQSA